MERVVVVPFACRSQRGALRILYHQFRALRVFVQAEKKGTYPPFRELPSFFMECLAYNCANHVFAHSTWTECLRAILFHIWDNLQGDEPAEGRWLEVNECFFLFHPGQKWSRADGREFAKSAWNYFGFK